MAVGTETEVDPTRETDPSEVPSVSICESRPGKCVFLEEGNTDGWIASDTLREVTR